MRKEGLVGKTSKLEPFVEEVLPKDTVLVTKKIYPNPPGAYYGFRHLGNSYASVSILNGGDIIPPEPYNGPRPDKVVSTALLPGEWTTATSKPSPWHGVDEPAKQWIISNKGGVAKKEKFKKRKVSRMERKGFTFVKPGSRPNPNFIILAKP